MAKTTTVAGDDNRQAKNHSQKPTVKPIGDDSSTTSGELTSLSCVAGVRDSLQKQGMDHIHYNFLNNPHLIQTYGARGTDSRCASTL